MTSQNNKLINFKENFFPGKKKIKKWIKKYKIIFIYNNNKKNKKNNKNTYKS